MFNQKAYEELKQEARTLEPNANVPRVIAIAMGLASKRGIQLESWEPNPYQAVLALRNHIYTEHVLPRVKRENPDLSLNRIIEKAAIETSRKVIEIEKASQAGKINLSKSDCPLCAPAQKPLTQAVTAKSTAINPVVARDFCKTLTASTKREMISNVYRLNPGLRESQIIIHCPDCGKKMN